MFKNGHPFNSLGEKNLFGDFLEKEERKISEGTH